jgi:hypothetical protein
MKESAAALKFVISETACQYEQESQRSTKPL